MRDSCGLTRDCDCRRASIERARPEQLGVGSNGDDSPLLHHRDAGSAISMVEGRWAMTTVVRPSREADQRGADPVLRRGIEGGGSPRRG